MMAVHQLSKYGITNIQTSYGPSISRIKQLNKAGLEIRKQYSVRDWLKGIAKVVKVGKKPQINKPNLKWFFPFISFVIIFYNPNLLCIPGFVKAIAIFAYSLCEKLYSKW